MAPARGGPYDRRQRATGAAERLRNPGSGLPSRRSGNLSARDWLFRRWYWYVSRIDKDAEVLFLNYGFSNGDRPIALDARDEGNRYCIQLYHHLGAAVDLRGKDLVEIGCGRGGGLSFITKTFGPATALGIDLEAGAVDFCNSFYRQPGLSFLQGDAQDLSLDDASCDVILNVESSHRYPDMRAFLAEARRILRPGGHLLLSDFRYDYDMPAFERDLRECGLALRTEADITANVLAALGLDNDRRRRLVGKMIPRFAQRLALNFAGAVGSPCYQKFSSHASVYKQYVFQKT